MRFFLALVLAFAAATASAAPHSHWRVFMSDNNPRPGDQWYGSMNEVEFQNAGVRLNTAGGVSFASSDQGATDPRQPFYAFDNDPNTLWSTLAGVVGPAWIGYTFSTAVDVTGVRMVTGGTSDRVTRAPETFQIQWSDDLSTWTTVETVTAATWVDSAYQSFTLAATAPTPTPPASSPTSSTDMTINCSVPNCAVTIQVAQAPTVNAEIMQAQTILFGLVFVAAVFIWGARRVLGLFTDHTPGD